MGQGAVRWTLQGKLLLSTKGTKESAGGAQGRWRREGAVQRIFNFQESESAFKKVKMLSRKGKCLQLCHNCCFLIIYVSA